MSSEYTGKAIEQRFGQLCAEAGRQGVMGFTPLGAVRLLPTQTEYLDQKLQPLKHAEAITAVSIGILYHPHEISVVPSMWKATVSPNDAWGGYLEVWPKGGLRPGHGTSCRVSPMSGHNVWHGESSAVDFSAKLLAHT